MRRRKVARTTRISLEDLARKAREGNSTALNQLLDRVQDEVYLIATRMLFSPDDAHDAVQEILLRIATRLSSFRGESAFATWVFRVAMNHLSSVRREKLEEKEVLERLSREVDLRHAESSHDQDPTLSSLLMEEVYIGRAIGMITCLDCPHRDAYLLGEILHMDCEEAALTLDIPSPTFRKRLSRARSDMICFMRTHFGLTDECPRRKRAQRAPLGLRAVSGYVSCVSDAQCTGRFQRVLEHARRPEQLQWAVALFPCPKRRAHK